MRSLSTASLVAFLFGLPLACGAPATPVLPIDSPPPGTAVPSGTGIGTGNDTPVITGAFVRHPPHSTNSDADGVDECTQVGGNYFSCRGAFFEEKDPVMKRYLWRIAQGHAAGEAGYGHQGEPETDLPHAEVPFMCDPTQPCGATNEHGELNHAVSCLAAAYAQQIQNHPAEAKAAHVHACTCDAAEGAAPGYNGTPFICDKAGRPAFIAPNMSAEEGADIILCAICHPERGPMACGREIKRLRTSDPELANHIQNKQVARCQTPNEGPNTWDSSN
jgi:hypothetical protein